ncbi:MAG: hypothetical protein WAN91_04045 [Saccharofermentanales bacterium]
MGSFSDGFGDGIVVSLDGVVVELVGAVIVWLVMVEPLSTVSGGSSIEQDAWIPVMMRATLKRRSRVVCFLRDIFTAVYPS